MDEFGAGRIGESSSRSRLLQSFKKSQPSRMRIAREGSYFRAHRAGP